MSALQQLAARSVQDRGLSHDDASTSLALGVPFQRVRPLATETTRIPLRYTAGGPGSPSASAELRVPYHGDILRNVTLEITMDRHDDADTHPFPAEAYIKSVRVSVGGWEIDALTGGGGTSGGGGWLGMRGELFGGTTRRATFAPRRRTQTFYVPLPLWFRDGNRPLPMRRLWFHEVRLNFEFRRVHGLTVRKVDALLEWTYVGDAESRQIRDTMNDDVIEQTQTTCVRVDGGPEPSVVVLPFGGPVRYLALDVRTPSGSPAELTRLALNVNGRVQLDEAGSFFNEFEPARRIGRVLSPGKYLVSFCTCPGDIRTSSGSLNLDRIDSTLLLSAERPCVVDVFAVRYNKMRYSGGMGSVSYASMPELVCDAARDAFPEATSIQAAWRGHVERRRHAQRLHDHYKPGGKGATDALRRLYDRADPDFSPPDDLAVERGENLAAEGRDDGHRDLVGNTVGDHPRRVRDETKQHQEHPDV